MLYVFITVFISVLLRFIFKFFSKYGVNTLVAIVFNYIIGAAARVTFLAVISIIIIVI